MSELRMHVKENIGGIPLSDTNEVKVDSQAICTHNDHLAFWLSVVVANGYSILSRKEFGSYLDIMNRIHTNICRHRCPFSLAISIFGSYLEGGFIQWYKS